MMYKSSIRVSGGWSLAAGWLVAGSLSLVAGFALSSWRFEVGGLNILPFSLKPLASIQSGIYL
jgi:hypothetical protein